MGLLVLSLTQQLQSSIVLNDEVGFLSLFQLEFEEGRRLDEEFGVEIEIEEDVQVLGRGLRTTLHIPELVEEVLQFIFKHRVLNGL